MSSRSDLSTHLTCLETPTCQDTAICQDTPMHQDTLICQDTSICQGTPIYVVCLESPLCPNSICLLQIAFIIYCQLPISYFQLLIGNY